jgi:hypothetical protein
VNKAGVQVTIARTSGAGALIKRMAGVRKVAAYVGVPSAGKRERKQQLQEMATKSRSPSKQVKLKVAAAANDITNAEALYLFTKGSPAKHQPARPVLEPAVQADGNREPIANELAQATKAILAGDKPEAIKRVRRAALAGQNAARGWFNDPRNNWAPNAPSTIAAKGSDRPGIDTGAMRASIQGLVEEEQ